MEKFFQGDNGDSRPLRSFLVIAPVLPAPTASGSDRSKCCAVCSHMTSCFVFRGRKITTRIRAGHSVETHRRLFGQAGECPLFVKNHIRFWLGGPNRAWHDLAFLSRLRECSRMETLIQFFTPETRNSLFVPFAEDMLLSYRYKNWEIILTDCGSEDVAVELSSGSMKILVYFGIRNSPCNASCPSQLLNLGPWLAPIWRTRPRATRHATNHSRVERQTQVGLLSFIPSILLKPLPNSPPTKGVKWRTNFYRIDHDKGESNWNKSWSTLSRIRKLRCNWIECNNIPLFWNLRG